MSILKKIKKFLASLFNNNVDLTVYRKKILMLKIKLNQHLKNGDYIQLRDIFIRLDSLLFQVCKIYRCGDETVAKQLKSDKAKSLFTRDYIHFMRRFHAIRNRVVHEDYVPSKEDTYFASKTIQALDKVLGQ